MKQVNQPISQMNLLKQHTQAPTSLKQIQKNNYWKWIPHLVLFLMVQIQSNNSFAGVPPVLVPDSYVLGTGVSINGKLAAEASIATAQDTSVMAIATQATMKTQEASLLTQADQYARQALELQELVIQTEMMIKDLEENPLQVITPDANQLMANQKRISALATDIANNSSNIGSNLVNNIKHPSTIGLGQGSKFALWSEARRKAVEEMYALNKQFIKDAASKDKSIWDAIKNIAHTKDKTATLKATANAAGQQLSWLQSIGETLNQLMGAQAVESGSKLEADIANAEETAAIIAKPRGSDIILQQDSYEGPGTSNSTGF